MRNLDAFFEKHSDQFLKFENVRNKLHRRPDLNAFLLLDKLVPEEGDIVTNASHDEIYLGTDVDKLLAVASSDDLLDLHRCGVLYSSDYDGLYMFT